MERIIKKNFLDSGRLNKLDIFPAKAAAQAIRSESENDEALHAADRASQVSERQSDWYHLLHPSVGQNLQSLIPQKAVIDCRMGSNPFGPPISLDHLQINVEPHTYLKPQANDELAYSLGRFLDMDPCFLALNGGSTNSMSTLLSRLLKPKAKKMLGISPQYTHAISEWLYFGGEYTCIPLITQEQHCLVSALIEAIHREVPDVLFLDNPNNPTGYFFEVSEIEELVQACHAKGIFCIIDEAYIDYLPREHSAIQLIPDYDNLIITRSFSKGMGMAALRIGYTVAQPEVTKVIHQLTLPYPIATPSLYIAQHVLDNVDLDKYLTQSAHFVANSKHELISACISAGFQIATTHPNVPLFAVCHDRLDPFDYFQNLQVMTTSGSNFQLDDTQTGMHFARLRVPESERELHQLSQRIVDHPIE